MNHILVTGGAGFIGSNLCEELLKDGKKVICIDNFSDNYDIAIKKDNIKKCLLNKNYLFNKMDIIEYDKLQDIFENHNITQIVHLAAKSGVRASINIPSLYVDVNVKGTVNLLELAKQFGIKNFIFGSSSSVYGANKKVPFSEKDRTDSTISPYAATKRSAELMCYTYNHLYNLNCTCLRFFTVYGPRGRPDMAVYKFTEMINKGEQLPLFGDGSSKRDFTYIGDIIRGIISAIDKELGFEIINLGNSEVVEVKYLISLIEKNLGKKSAIDYLPEQAGDVPITYADISKAKRLLGYNPKTKIEEGIKKFVEWYKAAKRS